MFTGVVLGLGIAALIYYVHKVGLPRIEKELMQARIEIVAAINRHGIQTAAVLTKPNPLPVNVFSISKGPDVEPQSGVGSFPQQQG